MKLEQRINRLEASNTLPVTVEALFAEVFAMEVFDADRVSALSRRMPEHELERAIAELGRTIEEENT